MQNEFCVDLLEEEKETLTNSVSKLITPINNLTANARIDGRLIVWLNWGIVKADLQNMNEAQLKAFNNFEYPEKMNLKKIKNSGKLILEKGSWSAENISELTKDTTDLVYIKQE